MGLQLIELHEYPGCFHESTWLLVDLVTLGLLSCMTRRIWTRSNVSVLNTERHQIVRGAEATPLLT